MVDIKWHENDGCVSCHLNRADTGLLYPKQTKWCPSFNVRNVSGQASDLELSGSKSMSVEREKTTVPYTEMTANV